MKQNTTAQTLEQLINALKAFPQIGSEDFAHLMSEAFSDFDCPVKYECDLTMGRHSVWVPECPQIADDITWVNAAEAARELTWFLNKFNENCTNLETAIN